jgi:hypothetical protein
MEWRVVRRHIPTLLLVAKDGVRTSIDKLG